MSHLETGCHTSAGRVAWVDTDASGRIHFTAAMRWAEVAEHSLLRSLGYRFVGGFPRVDVRAAYLAPLHFEDEFDLHLRVEAIGRTSITYCWQVVRGEVTCIRGRHVVVHVDDAGRSTEPPQALRADLTAMIDASSMPSAQ